MPTKVVPPVDVTMQRACRLLEAIRAAVWDYGCVPQTLYAGVRGELTDYDYTAAEYRAAIKALRDCGAIRYNRGIYTRGEMF